MTSWFAGGSALCSSDTEEEAEVVRLTIAKSHTACEQRLRDADVLVQAADATFILCYRLPAGGGGKVDHAAIDWSLWHGMVICTIPLLMAACSML